MSIADEVVHCLPLMYKVDIRSFWWHMASTYGSHSPVSTDVYYSQIAHKMPNLGYCTLSTQEMGWCTYKKRQPLLLKFVVPFLRCIRKARGASDSIYKSHIGHINIFFSGPAFKLHENCQIWGRVASLCMGKWVIYCKERYPLLLKHFKIFLRLMEGRMTFWWHL